VLLGRKTWEAAAVEGGGGGWSGGVQGYVFSRTLKSLSDPSTQLVNHDAGDFVGRLKKRRGKGICVLGGSDLARSLLAAGVIDEVGLNIHPILLGSGVPLFRDAGDRVKLELAECRTLDGGCLFARYRVVR